MVDKNNKNGNLPSYIGFFIVSAIFYVSLLPRYIGGNTILSTKRNDKFLVFFDKFTVFNLK